MSVLRTAYISLVFKIMYLTTCKSCQFILFCFWRGVLAGQYDYDCCFLATKGKDNHSFEMLQYGIVMPDIRRETIHAVGNLYRIFKKGVCKTT